MLKIRVSDNEQWRSVSDTLGSDVSMLFLRKCLQDLFCFAIHPDEITDDFTEQAVYKTTRATATQSDMSVILYNGPDEDTDSVKHGFSGKHGAPSPCI